MSDTVQTKITLKQDRATGISATHNGSNINGVAFNIDYISEEISVHLATALMELYSLARSLEK